MTEDIIVNLPTYEQLTELLTRIGYLDSAPTNVHPSNMNAKLNWLADNVGHTQWLIGNSRIPYGHQIFRQNGTFNVPAGIKTVFVTMVAGGGGGGGGSHGGTYAMAGGGGGAGAACYRVPIDVSTTPSVPVIVGAPGAGGKGVLPPNFNDRGGSGGNGGTSSFKDVAVGGGIGGTGGMWNNTGQSSPGGAASDSASYLGRACYPERVSNHIDPFTFIKGTEGGTVKHPPGNPNQGNPTPGEGGSFLIEQVFNSAKEDIYRFAHRLSQYGAWNAGIGGRGGTADILNGSNGGGTGGIGGNGVVIVEWGEVI